MAKQESGIITKGIVLFSVLLLLTNTVSALAFSSRSERALTEQIRARMLDIARSAATLLDGDELGGFTATDEDTPAYQQAMSTLRAFQESVELSYIYCVRQTGDTTFVFTVDPTVDDPAVFGEPVEYTEALDKAAHGVPAVDSVPYADRWGRFYSAYCPVFDSKGNVASIVGVDFAASWYEERIAQINRTLVVSVLASLVMAMLAALAANRLVSAEKRHGANLQQALLFDELTGLAKMGYFFDVSKGIHDDLVKQGKEPAILYVDLVGMKFFNQRQGFAEGDKLLQSLANLLSKHFGSTHCGRFGQDQFAVATNAEDLDARLDAFIAACAQINGGNNLPVRIGVYREALGEVNISTACDRAKAANMENSGAVESVYAYFNEAMLARMERRHYVTTNINRAIREGWIQVHYQPIVRAANGLVCDEEALARWVDPDRGRLAPFEFIPALEDTKLVYKLDLNVLEQTLAKMQRMADAGLYVVPASINLSRSDFEMCDMVEEVRARVDAVGIARNMINVEITETAMGRDFDFMKRQVERFHELGFQVWMDDFGSEYSSLDNLQNLPFDLIKFDMRFMRQFNNNDKSKVILTELTKMALGLGIDTICEGVETQEQVDFLREIGCSKLQGYYFSMPQSFEEILQRYVDGTGIGFENPNESAYFAALGRVNLYDLSSVAHEDEENLHDYFETLPMAVMETSDTEFALVRCNKTYRRFMELLFGMFPFDAPVQYATNNLGGDEFLQALQTCGRGIEHVWVHETMPGGVVVHTLVRHVATNPISGRVALVVVVLSIA